MRLFDGSTTLDVLDDLGVESTLLGDTHLSSEGGGGLPASRVAGVGLLHHLVDLLKSKTLGLVDEEVSVDEASSAERAPNEEDARSKVTLVRANHVGSDLESSQDL